MRIPTWMLRQTCSIEVYSASGAFGSTFGEAVEAKCRIEPSTRLVRDMDGNEVVASLRGFFAPGTVIPVESRVTWEGRVYTVLSSSPFADPQGRTHHVQVDLR
jgi:hypothetical protein